MRLLHSETGKVTFTKELTGNDQIPPYAILSHTWGLDNNEVTFEDISNGTGKDKSGYKKIQFCREQAKQDGLLYFWIDTCCINKKNNAELSRSINSMFRWYRNAARCYVYLSDVSSPVDNVNNECNPQPWESDFRNSRWFTRGWTLQELLAPISVEFFSQEHRRLGDKSSLEQQIYEITNVSWSALQGEPLSQFSVEERLRWIEHRQTKLEEDRAYSLLGIFDVYILPIYGEGTASALARLLDEFYKMQKCIQDLRLTDPRDDKKRIEDTKGGLLEDSYHWILENSDFQLWRNTQQRRLLWIKGDPGKGKTMLLCGITNELKRSIAKSVLLSYFFCQATDSRINYATAVLRGLIFLLVDQQPSLIRHIRTKYNQAGKMLFEDVNAWVALSEFFTSILKDPSLNNTYLIVDALDECVVDLPKLLDLIVQTSSIFPRIKWIVSSRNWPSIEKNLDTATQKLRLCFELNEKSVSAAVAMFIQFKVNWLAARNKYDNDERNAIQHYLSSNANGTFLWVALVCQELADISSWEAEERLTAFPPGLDAVYTRMMKQICTSKNSKLCKSILAVMSVVYRPVTLDELASLVDMPSRSSGKYKFLEEIVGLCGSFLTLRKHTIYFVHQSARDFLLKVALNDIFPSGIGDIHCTIFSRSLQIMSRTLRRDIYSLGLPGISIEKVEPPEPDPLAAAGYSCLYWVDHLLNCDTKKTSNELNDSGSVYNFFCQSYLYWLEALSLMKSLPSGIVMVKELESWLEADKNPKLYAFVYDAKRFALYNRLVLEQTPLQVYCSALIFAPEKSIVRETFETYIPTWIQRKPRVQVYWSASLQALEGHTRSVSSVAFSPDGRQVVSGSDDKTVQLWDTATGAVLQTLKGHTSIVNSAAFSPDGKQVVSGSSDKTVRLWDSATGVALQTLKGHTSLVCSVAFSPDGRQVVSGCGHRTVQLWDAVTGAALQTLEGHTDSVNSVAFSPHSKCVVSGSADRTVRFWDAVTGAALQTLEGHTSIVSSVAFSPDGRQVVSGSYDKTVRLWDTATGAVLQTLKGHTISVSCVAFSPDGRQVVSGSWDETVQLWDSATGAALQMLEGHTSLVRSVAFSPDGRQVVSGSYDKTVRLWDTTIGAAPQKLERHTRRIRSVAFSSDGRQVVSGSDDSIVRLWDAATGAVLQTLKGHNHLVRSVAFSPDGRQVVSGSDDLTVRLWDTATGVALQTLNGHRRNISSVAFSSDGRQVISGSDDEIVQLWDTATGAVLQTLKGHTHNVSSIAFSRDGSQVVSGSYDNTVRLWDTATGAVLQTLKGHTSIVNSVAFSPDGRQVVSGSSDMTVRLWDSATGAALQTLKGQIHIIRSVAFSPDGKLLPTLNVSNHWIVEGITNILWLPPEYRGTCIAVWEDTIILGTSAGRIFFLQFKKGPKLIT